MAVPYGQLIGKQNVFVSPVYHHGTVAHSYM
jgi:hypothetical protein